jgi:RNA polymerase sigma factor (sigma-70 family)
MKHSDINKADYDKNFTDNYRRHSAAVNRFLRLIVYNPDVCNELCQDVFLKVYERRIHLDPDSPCTLNFFFTIAKNVAIDHLRKKKKEDRRMEKLKLEEAALDRQFYEDIENMCLRGEVLSTLRDAIRSFPAMKRDIFTAANLELRSNASLARDSGMTVYQIKKIEEEVQRKIREELTPYFEFQE